MRKWFVAAALACVPSIAAAQWAPLPSGEFALTFDYAWAGSFSCIAPQYLVGSCSASGNSIRLQNGTAWADVTFTGASGTVTASAISQSIDVGLVSITTGGTGAFTWPTVIPQIPIFYMSVRMLSNGGTSSSVNTGWLRTSGTGINNSCCGEYGPLSFAPKLVVEPPPRPLSFYPFVEIFTRPALDINGPTSGVITTRIGLVPEPSTYALMAAGLVALGVVARRKRMV